MNGNIQKFINEIVKQTLQELAVNLSKAEAQNLCLAQIKGRLVLFDGNIFQEYIKAKYSQQKIDPNSYQSIIYGAIKANKVPECGYYEITLSVARSGFGPLMYDLMSSALYPNYIMSDRYSTSKEAQNIWNFLLNKRSGDSGDYEVKQITNTECHHQEFGHKHLDYVFKIKNPLDPSKLIDNANEIFDSLEDELSIPSHNVLDKLNSLAELMFASMVKDD